ncbi:FliM/FliN family flagellar motor switch protein [Chelativorans sp. Marseille-P2723]|uniref:FliM/FliN family flagellar motor switch protein n=1 Tax=Chelativorans sp. Marseille-P2723 TaxID=2709133 RepID=UPI00156F2C5B|nr:FliM/FliN family flagellar motor switch protein [Chelativorans sp. Marseille-P2723]
MPPDLSVLPAISPGIVALINHLAATRWLFVGPEVAPVPLAVHFGSRVHLTGTCVELKASTDLGTAVLCIEIHLIDLLSDYLLPGWREEDAACLPAEWRAIMALEAFAGEEMASRILEVDARVLLADQRHEGPPLTRLNGSVVVEGNSFPFSLELSGINESRIAFLLEMQPERMVSTLDPEFHCRVLLTGRPLSFCEYSGLEVGDTLFAGALRGEGLRAVLEVADAATFHAEIDIATGAINVLEDAGMQASMDNDEELEELALEAGAVYDAPPVSDPVGGLPVRLDFLLPARRISLSELRQLGPGAVLDLKLDLTQPVTILANGAPTARGHLVQIGETVGIQISYWPGIKDND